jgi:hypothetical protein
MTRPGLSIASSKSPVSNRLRYTTRFPGHAAVYAHLRVRNANGSSRIRVWIQHVIGNGDESPEGEGNERKVYLARSSGAWLAILQCLFIGRAAERLRTSAPDSWRHSTNSHLRFAADFADRGLFGSASFLESHRDSNPSAVRTEGVNFCVGGNVRRQFACSSLWGKFRGLHACGTTFWYIVSVRNIFLTHLFSNLHLKRKNFQEILRLPWAHRTRLQRFLFSLLTTNVSIKSGNLLFAQSYPQCPENDEFLHSWCTVMSAFA